MFVINSLLFPRCLNWRPVTTCLVTPIHILARAKYVNLPCLQGRIQGGATRGCSPPPPFPVPTTPLIYTSTRLTVESATKKLKGSSVLDFFQRKQLVTVRMNQMQSQLVLGTKTVLSSDHVHAANLRRT